MKKIMALFVIIMIICSSCGSSKQDMQLDVLQARNVAQLATLECYYHNVALCHKDDSSTWRFWEKNTKFWLWDKDTDFWIEYDGIITLGVDEEQIKMDVDSNNNVSVFIPKAKVLETDIDDDTYDESSEVTGAGTTEPTDAEESEAIGKAQKKMEKTAKNDKSLLNNAQLRVKEVINNYIQEVGRVIGVDYHVIWKYE